MEQKLFTINELSKLSSNNVVECKFVEASRINLDANKVFKELVKIDRSGVGGIQPEYVWEYAKYHTDSELHKGVDWDINSAAKKYQLQQIHQIIYNLRVVKVRALNSDDTSMCIKVNFQPYTHLSTSKGYDSTFRIVSDVGKYEQLKRDAYRDLLHWQQKYLGIVELKEVFEAIDKLQI